MKKIVSDKADFKYSFIKFPRNVKYTVNTGINYQVLFFLTGKASIEVCGYSKIRISGGEAVFLPANSEWTLISQASCQISVLYYKNIAEARSRAYLKYLLTDFSGNSQNAIGKLTMCEAMTEFSVNIKENILTNKVVHKIMEYDCFVILNTYYSKEEAIKFLCPYLSSLDRKKRKKIE